MADDTVRTSVNLGVGVMMAITAVVLAGFVRFIIGIMRRARHSNAVGAELKVGPSNA